MTTQTKKILEFFFLRFNLPKTSRVFSVQTQNQQPGRDAKVLTGNQTGMWEQDQTDLPNESLTGNFQRPC